MEAAARHGVAAGLLGAGGHGKGPLDPLLTRQGGLQLLTMQGVGRLSVTQSIEIIVFHDQVADPVEAAAICTRTVAIKPE